MRTCACASAHACMRVHVRMWMYLCMVVPSNLVVHATPNVPSWHGMPCHMYVVSRMGCGFGRSGYVLPPVSVVFFMFNRGRCAENSSKDGCCSFVCCCSGWSMACGFPLLTSLSSECAHAFQHMRACACAGLFARVRAYTNANIFILPRLSPLFAEVSRGKLPR